MPSAQFKLRHAEKNEKNPLGRPLLEASLGRQKKPPKKTIKQKAQTLGLLWRSGGTW